MTPDLLSLLAEYRAGLEAEMVLLHQLDAHAGQQRTASVEGSYSTLPAINDAREATMASLVSIEHDLKPLRERLLRVRAQVEQHPTFQQIVAGHRQAAELVAAIAESDRRAMAALKAAEDARRDAAATMEKGESTLAAYRRVIAPSLANATLVNRRG